MLSMRSRGVVVSLAAIAIIVTACSGGGGSSKAATTTTSAADMGGMEELVKAAEAEGTLNVIAVPPEWANYKGILEKFKAKYPTIKVDEQGPDFNSQQEIDAVNNQKGTDKAPDVFDLAPSVALANTAIFAPYKVAAWADIPDNLKESTGLWFSDYAGFTSIGCDTNKVAAPATVADMLKPEYKGMIALNGNPKSASAGFHGVVMAALANGGTADDISAGVKFFKRPQRPQATCCRSTRPRRPSPPARRRASSTGSTTTPRLTADLKTKGIDWQVSRSRRTPRRSRRTTTRPSTRTPRIRRPRASGRSTCTRPRPRTSG